MKALPRDTLNYSMFIEKGEEASRTWMKRIASLQEAELLQKINKVTIYLCKGTITVLVLEK